MDSSFSFDFLTPLMSSGCTCPPGDHFCNRVSKRSHKRFLEPDDALPSKPLKRDELETLARQEQIRTAASWLSDPQDPDLTTKCGDKEWKVHKFILTTRCDFFRGC